MAVPHPTDVTTTAAEQRRCRPRDQSPERWNLRPSALAEEVITTPLPAVFFPFASRPDWRSKPGTLSRREGGRLGSGTQTPSGSIEGQLLGAGLPQTRLSVLLFGLVALPLTGQRGVSSALVRVTGEGRPRALSGRGEQQQGQVCLGSSLLRSAVVTLIGPD